jgi:flagellar hook-length control protein FliK
LVAVPQFDAAIAKAMMDGGTADPAAAQATPTPALPTAGALPIASSVSVAPVDGPAAQGMATVPPATAGLSDTTPLGALTAATVIPAKAETQADAQLECGPSIANSEGMTTVERDRAPAPLDHGSDLDETFGKPAPIPRITTNAPQNATQAASRSPIEAPSADRGQPAASDQPPRAARENTTVATGTATGGVALSTTLAKPSAPNLPFAGAPVPGGPKARGAALTSPAAKRLSSAVQDIPAPSTAVQPADIAAPGAAAGTPNEPRSANPPDPTQTAPAMSLAQHRAATAQSPSAADPALSLAPDVPVQAADTAPPSASNVLVLPETVPEAAAAVSVVAAAAVAPIPEPSADPLAQRITRSEAAASAVAAPQVRSPPPSGVAPAPEPPRNIATPPGADPAGEPRAAPVKASRDTIKPPADHEPLNTAPTSPGPQSAANESSTVATAAGGGADGATIPPTAHFTSPPTVEAVPPAATRSEQEDVPLSPLPASPVMQVAPVLVSLARAPGGTQTLTVRLDPPELGHVQVRIERPQEAPARVEITVEKSETLTLLLRDQPQLQRALDQAGVPAEGRSVTFHVASPDPMPRIEPALGSSGRGRGRAKQRRLVRRTTERCPDGATGGRHIGNHGSRVPGCRAVGLGARRSRHHRMTEKDSLP